MRYLVSLIVIAFCNLAFIKSLPIPAGQIIQYSVSSKYFQRNNSTSNNLYDILSQIHYGGNPEATSKQPQQQLEQTTDVTTVSDGNDVKNDATTMAPVEMDVTDSNESREHTTIVTDDDSAEKTQQEKETNAASNDNPVDNDESITSLIEQVVNEQIDKLASFTDIETKINLLNEQKDVIEKFDLVDESDAISSTEKVQPNDDDDKVIATTKAPATDDINSEKAVEIETTTEAIPAMAVIESDSESESTNKPDVTTNVETIQADVEEQQEDHDQESSNGNEKLSTDDTTDDKYEIPNSLMGAIGDLLSSVLGIPLKVAETPASDGENVYIPITTAALDEDEEKTTENDILEQSTEQELSTSSPTFELNENNAADLDEIKTTESTVQDDNKYEIPQSMSTSNVNTNEIDLKIENLANGHDTQFMTENTSEVYTDAVKEDDDNTDKNHQNEVLEAQPAPTTEDEASNPDSFQESVNHIMNLIRESEEDRLALENAENVVDSILIDHKTINDNVNQILNGALKEIETSFGLNEADKEIEVPSRAIDVVDHEKEELMKNFETDINESLTNSNDDDDQDDFLPNMAKAALFNRYQYGDDFIRK